jgi:hypothetical protein
MMFKTVFDYRAEMPPIVIARSEATKQSIYSRAEEWIASLRSQ